MQRQGHPLKVLLLTWEYPPRVVGSLADHIHNLAHGLAARGLDVTVVHPSDADREYLDGAVRVLTATHPIKHHTQILNYIWALSIALTRRSADFFHSAEGKSLGIIHAHEWTACIPAIYLKWSFKLPIVLTMYSTESIRGGKGTLLGDGIVEVENFCLQNCDIVLAGSSEVASRLRTEYGVAAEKILSANLGLGEVEAALDAYRRLEVKA
jgi:glycogen(starch) synthase